jgi:hypothetical protein
LRRGLAALRADAPAAKEQEALVRFDDVLGIAALRYLDLMVVRSMWNEWSLTEFFQKALPKGEQELPPSDVVFIAGGDRCLGARENQPGSAL